MTLNVPLKWTPLLKSYIWGGDFLKCRFPAKIPEGPLAESWEIADYRTDNSVVSEGPFSGKSLRELMLTYRQDLCGEAVDPINPQIFPLLLKIIDAKLSLSVQVHPDNQLAEKWHLGELGKSEAWYILSAEPHAFIYCGLKPGVSKSRLKELLEKNQVEECLNRINVKSGDFVAIPAGTIHALGAGIRVIEIQQNSNTTYRLYDWGRLGVDGKPRQLHIAEALKAIKIKKTSEKEVGIVKGQKILERSFQCMRFVEWEQFIAEFLTHFEKEAYSFSTEGKSFHILTVVKGNCIIEANGETVELSDFDSVLIPAKANYYQLFPSSTAEILHFYRKTSQN